ncbi:MAG: hypothetical protein U1E65_11300 [Myxococcota bacterium]
MSHYSLPPKSVAALADAAIATYRSDLENVDAQLDVSHQMEDAGVATEDANKRQGVYAAYTHAATTTVQQGMSLVGTGQKVAHGFGQNQAKVEVAKSFEAAKTGQGAGKLEDVQIGDHQKLGDRYNRQQLAILSKGQPFTEKDLQAAGFPPHQHQALLDAQARNGGNGISTDQAVHFIFNPPPDPAMARGEAVKSQLITQLIETPGKMQGLAAQTNGRNAKVLGDAIGQEVGLRKTMRDAASAGGGNARATAVAVSGKQSPRGG